MGVFFLFFFFDLYILLARKHFEWISFNVGAVDWRFQGKKACILFCKESTEFYLHNWFPLGACVAFCVCRRLSLSCVNTGSGGGCVRVVLVVVLRRQSLISRFARSLLNAFWCFSSTAVWQVWCSQCDENHGTRQESEVSEMFWGFFYPERYAQTLLKSDE